MQAQETFNSEHRIVLDYAPAGRSRFGAVAVIGLRCGRAVWWFLAHRSLRALEIAFGGWVAWCGLYVFWAARRFELGSNSLKPALAFTWIIPVVVLISLLRLTLKRRWKALALTLIMIVLTMPATGMIQTERCPHAGWLQVLGMSFPIDGARCGNPRNVEPWWM